MESICGADCSVCPSRAGCRGCASTGGRPFGGTCMLAACLKKGGSIDSLKEELIREFNALGIEDMPPITGLYALCGAYINMEYPLPGGGRVRFFEDNRIYLGTQLQKAGGDRCYGLCADETHLLVSEYGRGGADPEVVVYCRRGVPTERRKIPEGE